MKLNFKIVLSLLLLPILSFSQTMRENKFVFRGPVDPLNTSFSNAKTLSVEIQVSSDFESEIHKFAGSVSISTIEAILFENTSFFAIKSEKTSNKRGIDGDLKLTYHLKKFKIIGKKEISKSPAWIIGFESDLNIADKENSTIYTRYTPLTVKTYIANPNETINNVVDYIIDKDFKRQFEEFSITYLKQPVYSFDVIDFEQPKKEKNILIEKSFIDTFNQSVDIFRVMEKVDESKYSSLFEAALPYWESLRTFDRSKDKDFNRDVQYAANINLATAYLLLDQGEKANMYIEKAKTYKLPLFRVNRSNNLEKWNVAIEEAKEVKKAQSGTFVALKNEENNLLYSQSVNTYEKLSFQGLVKNKKGAEFAGQVNILNNNPLVVDLRSIDSMIPMLGKMINTVNAPRNTVLVELANKKKPEKMNIDDLVSISLSDATILKVDKVGSALDGTERYSILREIQQGKNLSLYVEEYPNSGTILLKKNHEDNFFEIPTLVNRKKLLLKYFDNCPNIHPNIQNGKYLDNQNKTYLILFKDFNELCN